tara:strand:+ start:1841 stop:2377 length:537 start_codon:yes stop_codon:yes gene_type:complete
MGYLPPELEEASYEQQLHYVKMVEDGQTEQFAVMCALRQPPATKGTDRTFMEGKLNQQWLDDMPPFQAKRMLREAKQAGIDTTGKFYMSGLADRRGAADPMAWISTTAEIKEVAKARNLEVKGIVNVKAEQREPERKDFSKAVEQRLTKHYKKKHQNISTKAAKELARKNHLPNWKKK